MALDKAKMMWPIWIMVVVASVLVILSFSKEKKGAASSPAVDVLTDKPVASAVPAAKPEATIKPPHTVADQAVVAAVKPAEAVVMPLQEVLPKVTLAVQVYSFKEKARADVALQKLKDKGYPAYIMVSDLGARGTWYRVRVGPMGSEEEARKKLEEITQDFKSGIIVTE